MYNISYNITMLFIESQSINKLTTVIRKLVRENMFRLIIGS